MTTRAKSPPNEHEAQRARRGFGVRGSLPAGLVRELATAAEEAGYHTFWVNDGADGEGLAALAEAATVTGSIRLAVGAIPLDRRGPEQIAARIAELRLPEDRLVIGVGSGGPVGGLARVRAGIAALRQATSAVLVVAAMGPKMCALAGEIGDGLLLDWATPAYASHVQAIAADAARSAGRPRQWLADYIFTASGAASIAKLEQEAAYYGAIPSYAAHFARMAAGPLATTAAGADRPALQQALLPFDTVLDEPVVRAVVDQESAESYLALLRAAAP